MSRLGQLAGEVDGLVDRVGPGRGHQDEGGGRLDQQLAHPGGPVAEALLHPLEGLEEGDRVADDVGPATLEMVRSSAWAATPMNRRPARVGVIRAWKIRFSRKWVSRRGASRKSRALRDGGVSTTTTSKPPSSTSS